MNGKNDKYPMQESVSTKLNQKEKVSTPTPEVTRIAETTPVVVSDVAIGLAGATAIDFSCSDELSLSTHGCKLEVKWFEMCSSWFFRWVR